MTSTEIIIRIKKARKKWKLVVPKKRVAAYRTNRWFAKPRWVEIELSYTQASKLGLVELRTRSKEVTSESTAQQAATHPIVESDHTVTGGSASEPEPDSTSTWQTLFERHPNVDQPGRLLSTDDVDFVADADDLEDDDALLRSLPHDGCHVPSMQTLPMAAANVGARHSTSAVATACPHTDRLARRAGAFLLISSSASVLVGIAAAWTTFSGFSIKPTTVDLACTRAERSSPCTQTTVVTGAIGNVDQPQWLEPRPSAAFTTHASSEATSAIEQLQLSTPQLPKTATAPTEREDGSRTVRNQRTGTSNTAGESNPLPAAEAAKTSLLPQDVSAERHDCGELRTASRSINIPFAYASSSLNSAILPVLESFAMRLRSCPSTKVIIEGHTDSDGRTAWNKSLSVHRAKAVLEHLVRAGVQPSQLSAIGFGQFRPLAPNVSAKNKRNNRRATLVVDVPR